MSKDSIKKAFIIYIAATVFCLIFFLIYNVFSHDVTSPFMTFLFAWPLLLGVLPCAALLIFRPMHLYPNWITANLYNSGVAALTVSSAMKGVFDIAGTSSIHQSILMVTGFLLLGLAALELGIGLINKQMIIDKQENSP